MRWWEHITNKSETAKILNVMCYMSDSINNAPGFGFSSGKITRASMHFQKSNDTQLDFLQCILPPTKHVPTVINHQSTVFTVKSALYYRYHNMKLIVICFENSKESCLPYFVKCRLPHACAGINMYRREQHACTYAGTHARTHTQTTVLFMLLLQQVSTEIKETDSYTITHNISNAHPA